MYLTNEPKLAVVAPTNKANRSANKMQYRITGSLIIALIKLPGRVLKNTISVNIIMARLSKEDNRVVSFFDSHKKGR